MKRYGLALALLLMGLQTACGRDGPRDSSGLSVQDSAGVRLVHNGDAPLSRWRTGESPLFTVGWGPGEPAFTWIQSGRILPDGGAVVGDFRAGAIYRLGHDGSVLGTWGRKGEGPGEYQGLDAIISLGDSILVSDGRLRRVTVLSAQGEVLATHPLVGAFLHQVSSALPDGRLLFVPGEGYSGISDVRPEWVFETQPILAADLQNGWTDTIADLPHLRRWFGTRGASPGPVTVRGRAAGFADGFVWARADRSEVQWYDHTGVVTQISRWREAPAPLTSEWRAEVVQILKEAYASNGAEEGVVTARIAELEEGFDQHEGPLPYWDEFHVDRGGNAWLRDYGPPTQPSERWRVIARDGTFVGWLQIPEVIAILDITDDRILAVRFDDLDVPAVVMVQLLRG